MRMLPGCLALTLAASAGAQSMPQDAEGIKARCAEYAREDQVPDKELASYMKDCINALSTPTADEPPSAGTASPDERY